MQVSLETANLESSWLIKEVFDELGWTKANYMTVASFFQDNVVNFTRKWGNRSD